MASGGGAVVLGVQHIILTESWGRGIWSAAVLVCALLLLLVLPEK